MRRFVLVLFFAMLALTGCSGSQHHSAAKDPTRDIEYNPNIPGSVKGSITTISPSVEPTRSGQKVCQMFQGERLCMVYAISARSAACPTRLVCSGLTPMHFTSTLNDGTNVYWIDFEHPDMYTVIRTGETLRQISKRFGTFEKENDPTLQCVSTGSGATFKSLYPGADAPLTKGTVVSWC